MSQRPPVPVPIDDPRVEAFRLLLGVTDRLRAEDGCPWDLEQTESSMAPFLVEEAHELVEAIETESASDAADEAGDVLGGLMILCRIAQQAGRYDLGQVARASAEKLIRRHPHVFADSGGGDAATVLKQWNEIKAEERTLRGETEDSSALSGIPKALPALQRATRTCDKAVNAGFSWPTMRGALAKIHEELAELEAELPDGILDQPFGTKPPAEARERVVAELGDLLLSGAYFARYMDLDPEAACRAAVRRFDERFRRMEAAVGGTTRDMDLDTLEAAWEAEKAHDASEPFTG
jgi:nucleoside triphosphate diphosphatase